MKPNALGVSTQHNANGLLAGEHLSPGPLFFFFFLLQENARHVDFCHFKHF